MNDINGWDLLKNLSEKSDNELRTMFGISISENCDVLRTILCRYTYDEAISKCFEYITSNIRIGDVYVSKVNPSSRRIVAKIDNNLKTIDLMNDRGYINKYTLQGLDEFYYKVDINVFDEIRG